jgi:hypothetical protein
MSWDPTLPAWCASCGQPRRLEEVIAFWPAGRESERRFVCRPTLNEAGRYGQPCFREAVKARDEHEIGAAA